MPVPPEMTRAEAMTRAPSSSDTSMDLDTAKKLLSGWRVVYIEAAESRRRWQLGFGEALFYGSVFAVLGTIRNHDHLRNLGIGAAVGSSLLGSHYQASAQLTAFRKAIKRLNCLEETVMQITPEDEIQFSELTPQQKQTLVDLPVRLVNRVEKVRTELGDTLNGIQLSTPSKEEIASMFQKWLVAKQSAVAAPVTSKEAAFGKVPGALVDPVIEQARLRALQIRRDRFVAALDRANPEIDVCMAGADS